MDSWPSSKKNGVLIVIFVSCTIIYIVYISINIESALRPICGVEWTRRDEQDADSAIGSSIKRNVFLIETTGREDMNPRQLCAIESASKHNPDFNVVVYLKNPKPKPILTALSDKYNVMYEPLNVEEMFRDTPLERLVKSGKIQRSQFVTHMSDLLRLMVLWQRGGIYLDLDMIVFKSLARLENFGILEDDERVGSAAIGFRKRHPVMKVALDLFAMEYNPDDFALNGPALISTAIKIFCDEVSLEYVPVLGCGVNVYPKRAAFEIYYPERAKFFENDTRSVEFSLQRLNKSLMTHLWNFLTGETKAKIGDNTLLELLMKEHCPLVYSDLLTRGLTHL